MTPLHPKKVKKLKGVDYRVLTMKGVLKKLGNLF